MCRGFDPLRLFQNPAIRPWLVEGELYNGRIAMLAAAGDVSPQILIFQHVLELI